MHIPFYCFPIGFGSQEVENYWAKDLPVRVGHCNFAVIRVEFYRERQTAFEAFKKGGTFYREEFTSKNWATEYNFPAVEEGKVIRREFPDGRPSGAQGWFINTRLDKFKDPRVREALELQPPPALVRHLGVRAQPLRLLLEGGEGREVGDA